MDVVWLLVVVGFVVGSFPSARLVGRLVGHNPTREGSRNPGATNMFRIAGKRAGAATLIFDICKALGAALMGRFADGTTLAAACGAAAVVGHIFPVISRGPGGKGVACFGGLTIGAWPLIAPFGLVAWVLGARLGRRSFIGALVAVPIVAAGVTIIGRPVSEIVIVWALAALIVVRHHVNIREFLNRPSL